MDAVKLAARIAAVVAGVLGIVLAGSGTSFAHSDDIWPQTFSGVSGKTGATIVNIGNGPSCLKRVKRVKLCVNGPLHSGNTNRSGNFTYGKGNANNTGNFADVNGSTNSNNVTHGSSPNGYDNQLSSGRHH
jgi:hypothetical protein